MHGTFNFMKNSKFLMLALLGLLMSLGGSNAQSMTLVENNTYFNMAQDTRSYAFYQFSIGNKTQQILNSAYLAVRMDIEDSTSEPELYISRSNATLFQNPDQQCTKAGSNLCIIKRSLYKANDTLYMGVRCVDKCLYTLRVTFTPVQVIADGSRSQLRMESRSHAILQFTIPETNSDGLISSVQFQVEQNSFQTMAQVLFSPVDDLSLILERDMDLTIDSGRGYRFTSDDIGWCNKCQVFLILNARTQDNYTISARFSGRRDLLQEQVPMTRVIRQQQRECFSYNILRANTDAMITMRQHQGDSELALSYRQVLNTSLETPVLLSEISQSRALILRASDRSRFNQSTGTVSACVTPQVDSSIQLFAAQQFTSGRFEAEENILYTFNLNQQDFIQFRYSNPSLASSRQIILTTQGFGSAQAPRILVRTCNSPMAEDCSLTEMQGRGQSEFNFQLAELNFTIDPSTNLRTTIYSHASQTCLVLASCHLLISIFNPERLDLQKSTFRLQLSNPEPVPLMLNQQYFDLAEAGSIKYFQLNLTPFEQQALSLTQIRVNQTCFNGAADIYLSTTTRTPGPLNFELKSRSFSYWNNLVLDLSDKDMRQPIFIAVIAQSFSAYQLRISAITNANVNMTWPQMPTNISSNATQGLGNVSMRAIPRSVNQMISLPPNIEIPRNTTTQLVLQSIIQDNYRRLQDQISSARPDLILFYQPSFDPRSTNKLVHIFPELLAQNVENSTILFNVSYGNQSWNNNSRGLSLAPDQWVFDANLVFTIRLRGDFSRVNRTALNMTALKLPVRTNPQTLQLNMTFMLNIYTSLQQGQDMDFIDIASVYENFANSSVTQFKTRLMDSNGTYVYRLRNIIGKPFFMQRNGRGDISNFDIADDATYDFASNTFDNDDSQTLSVTRVMRDNANFRCRNGSFPIRGGNDNCTQFIAVQCRSLCVFTLSITLLEARNRTVPIPMLITEDQTISNFVDSNRTLQYYLPFVRGQLVDTALTFERFDPSTIVAVRVISNGHLPYFNWSYPNATQFDFVGRNNGSSSEIIDLSAVQMLARCPSNASCVLLVSVQNVANITRVPFNMNLYSNRNRIANATVMRQNFTAPGDMQYFWFLINMTQLQRPAVPWRHLITIASSSIEREVDLFINIDKAQRPTQDNFDYKGDRFGNDAIVLSSDMPLFQNVTKDRVIVTIGVRARGFNFTYSLMNWGPNPYDSQFLNFTDLRFGQVQNVSLPTRQMRPASNYRMFRFFNNGTRDFTINITALSGQVFVLGNRQLYKEQDSNAYFSIPVIPQLSRMNPANLNRTSFVMRVNARQNTDYLCNFCWLYFAVYQNSTLSTQAAQFLVNMTDHQLATEIIPILRVNEQQTFILNSTGQVIQRRMMFDSKNPFFLTVTPSSASANYIVYLGLSADYLNTERLWQVQSTGRERFTMKQTDRNLSISTYYFITIVARSNNQNIQVRLEQDKNVQYLRNDTSIVDRMNTPEDFVKYYYFQAPRQAANYTVTVQITPKTQGYYPSIYAQRNDLLNNTFNFKQLAYPSVQDFNLAQEQQFFRPWQSTYTFTFNCTAQNSTIQFPTFVLQNFTVNQTVQVNVTQNITNTTTKRNQTVTVLVNRTVQVNQTRNVTVMVNVTSFNQTYYTMAIYWNTFGLSDLQKTEYEISYIMRPIGNNNRPIIRQSSQTPVVQKSLNDSFKDVIRKAIKHQKERLQ